MFWVIDGSETPWKWVLDVLEIVVHIIIGCLNPLDLLGDSFWSINLTSGIRIPGFYVHSVALGRSGLRLSSLSWNAIRINWNGFQKLHFALDGLRIDIDENFCESEAAAKPARKVPCKTKAPSSSIHNVLKSLKSPWWGHWLPGIEIKTSNEATVRFLGLELSTEAFFVGILVMRDSYCDVSLKLVGAELAIIQQSHVTTELIPSESPAVPIVSYRNKSQAPFYVRTSSVCLDVSLGNWQPIDSKCALVCGLRVEQLGCSFDAQETNYVCAIVHHLISTLTCAPIMGSSLSESSRRYIYSNKSFRHYKNAIAVSRQIFESTIDDIGSHNGVREELAVKQQSSDLINYLQLSVFFEIENVLLGISVGVLEPTPPLKPRGPKRSLRNPLPFLHCARNVSDEERLVIGFRGLHASAKSGNPSDGMSVILKIGLESIETASVMSLLSVQHVVKQPASMKAPLCSFDVEIKSADIRIGSSNYPVYLCRAGGSVNSVSLAADISVLSQCLYFAANVMSAVNGAKPVKSYQPVLIDGLGSAISGSSGTRDYSGNTPTGRIAHWEESEIICAGLTLSLRDDAFQFSSAHSELLTIRAADISFLLKGTTSGSNLRSSSECLSDSRAAEDFHECFSHACTSGGYTHMISTHLEISVESVEVINDCNTNDDNDPWRPHKYGRCSCGTAALPPLLSVSRLNIVKSYCHGYSTDQNPVSFEGLPAALRRIIFGLPEPAPVYSHQSEIDLSEWLMKGPNTLQAVPYTLSVLTQINCNVFKTLCNQFDAALLSSVASVLIAGASKPPSGFQPTIPAKVSLSDSLLIDLLSKRTLLNIGVDRMNFIFEWAGCQDMEASRIHDCFEISVPSPTEIEAISAGLDLDVSSCAVKLDDILVTRTTAEGVVNKLQVHCRTGTDSRDAVFHSVWAPVDIWQSGIEIRAFKPAVIRHSRSTTISLADVNGNIDSNTLDVVFRIKGICVAESEMAEQSVRRLLGDLTWSKCVSIISPVLFRRYRTDCGYSCGPSAEVVGAPSSPVSTVLIGVVCASINFEQFGLPLLDVSVKNIDLATISFGPNLNQTCGSFKSLKCLDRTMPSAVHQNIFASIDPSNSMTNRFEFHCTSTAGECSLLEIRGAFLRVVYLQRPVMAAVMYFRDFFIPSMGAALRSEVVSWRTANGYDIEHPVVETKEYPLLGQFRFTIELNNCEVHIPTNASGTDCLTALFPRLYAFKSAFELTREYCLGPMLADGTWLSQLRFVPNTLKKPVRKPSRGTGGLLSDEWTLVDRMRLLRAPASEFGTVKTFKLDVECENAVLCSWCNRNEVGSGIDLKAFITFEGVPPAVDSIYAPVFESLGYLKHDKNNRNKVVVDISSSEVDWTIAQGQYAAIVYLIQQNIPEQQFVVKDVNGQPFNKLVELDTAIYGIYSLERRIPLFTTVPIHIASGRLTAVDNEPEYLDLYGRLLHVEDNFQATKSETFPIWSNHHVHRSRLFSGCALEDDEFWYTVRRSYQEAPNQTGIRRLSSTRDSPPQSSEIATIVTIYFHRLEVDFFKLHYGAGAGIDVAAGSIIITCAKFSTEDVSATVESGAFPTHYSVDLEGAAPETIIFAPKTMPQLCKSTVRATQHSPLMEEGQSEVPGLARRRRRITVMTSDIANIEHSYHPVDNANGLSGPLDVSGGDCNSDDGSDDGDYINFTDGENFELETYVDCQSRPCGDWSWHGDNVVHRGTESVNIGEFVPQLRYRQQGVANLRRCVVDIVDCVLITHVRPIMAAVAYFVDPISLNNLRSNALLAKEGFGALDFKAGLDVEVHTKSTVIAIPKFSDKEDVSVLCVQSDLDYNHAFRGFREAGPAKVTIDVAVNIYSIFITPIHEIRAAGAESIIDPCFLNVESVWDLQCPEEAIISNFKSLGEHMMTHNMPHRPSRSQKAFPVRSISVKLTPSEDVFQDISTATPTKKMLRKGLLVGQGDGEDDENLILQILKFKFSLKDIFFVVSAGRQLLQSWHTRRQQNPLIERYFFLFDGPHAFRDIMHLERATANNAHVKLLAPPDQGDQDVVVDSCGFDVILKNNTYNLKIAKVEFRNFNLSYSKAFNRLHMATGLTVAAWTFNENADVWEPIIESVDGSCIAASDTSSTAAGNLVGSFVALPVMSSRHGAVTVVPPVRYDVFCNPVCVNAPESTTVSLIRKFSLADVITTSSIHLPPYRVVNELGLGVMCTLNIGATQIYESEITVGNYLPIERREIAKASYQSNRRAHHRRLAVSSITASADNDHKLGLIFEFEGESYCSKEPLPIDREGVFAFDMKPSMTAKPKRMSAAFENLAALSLTSSDNLISEKVLKDETYSGVSGLAGTVKMHGGGIMTISQQASSAASVKSMKQTLKSGTYVPFSLVSMRMKDDGGRELVLRSVLSLKNLTSRTIYVCVRRGTVAVENAISSGSEWNVPIQVAHPKSSLYIRHSEVDQWWPILATLGSLILQGSWGAPSKLKAEVCCCPADSAKNANSVETDWMLLLRPEVRDTKGGAMGSRTFIPVKYPGKDIAKNRQAQLAAEIASGGSLNVDATSDMFGFGELYSSSFGSGHYRSVNAQPMCFQLIAPLQMCNLLSQPLLYRVADNEGLIVSEGTLLPGEIIDLHSIFQLFSKRIFLSIRMLNYCWSKWTKILSKNNPFPTVEKQFEIPLSSMNLFHQGSDLNLPIVDVICSMRENIIRISCPIIIRNCTGLQLDIAESASLDLFTPHSSQPPIETVVAMKLRASSAAAENEGLVQPTVSVSTSHHVPHQGSSSSLSLQNPDGKGDTRSVLPLADHAGDAADEVANSEFQGRYFTSDDAVEVPSANELVETVVTANTPGVVGQLFETNTPSGSSTPSFGVASGSLLQRGPAAKVNNTITIIVHMPFDHMSKLEVAASPDWTLATVFAKIMHKLAANKSHRSHYSYVFLPWEAGSRGPGTVPHSPAVEANLFGSNRNSISSTSTNNSFNSASMANNGSKRFGREVSDGADIKAVDEEDDDEDEEEVPQELHKDTKQAELLTAHLARKSEDVAASKSSFFSRRSISGMFSNGGGNQSPRLALHASQGAGSSHADSNFAPKEDGIPPSMAFAMVADCSLTGLSMDTKVEHLPCHRMRLCHVTEFRIYEQVQNIKAETVVSEGLMTMFRGSKVKRKTIFEKLDGDLPFNPKRSMLGFSPSLCLRVAHLTGWSSPLELYSGNFGSGTDYVSVNSMQYTTSRMQDVHFEFGAYAERGKGFFQNILCVTIVPKHILVFKLRLSMQIRQLGDNEVGRHTTLKPGSIQNYHYPVVKREKYLQVRRGDSVTNKGVDEAEAGTRNAWFGEIDITRLGIVYVKLRDPLFIVKVQVEMVGASLIATMAPQDKQWPPYRLDNQTTLLCRFRQMMTVTAPVAVPHHKDVIRSQKIADTSFNSEFNPANDDRVPWDHLRQGESCPYAWDHPISGEKMVRLEFSQGPTWVGFDVSLDDVSKPRVLSLQRPLVGLNNPQAEGWLKFREASTETFVSAYCILKGDAIYMFKDHTRNELIEVVCLARSVCTTIPNNKDVGYLRKDSIKLSSVFKYVENGWGLYNSILGGVNRGSANIDMNKARILLLLLADGLGVFKTVPKGTKASKEQARERAESFASESTDVSSVGESFLTPAPSTQKVGVEAEARETIPDATQTVEDQTLRSPFDSGNGESPLMIETTNGRASRTPPVGTPYSIKRVAAGDFDEEEDEDNGDSPRQHGSCLREQLQLGVPIDQLLEYISEFTFEMFDIAHTLMNIDEAVDVTAARSVCCALAAQGILVIVSPDVDKDDPNTSTVGTPLSSKSNSVSAASSSDNVNAHLSNSKPSSNTDLVGLMSLNTVPSGLDTNAPSSFVPGSRFSARNEHIMYDGHDSQSEEDDEDLDTRDKFDVTKNAITSRASITVTGMDIKELKQSSQAEMLASSMTMSTKLTFGMPSLFPELAALAAADDEVLRNARDRMTILGGVDENEAHGFTIFRADGAAVHFQCSTEHEFLGWIQGCRQNIEQVWFRFVSSLPSQTNEVPQETCERSDCYVALVETADEALIPVGLVSGNISVDSFKLKLNLKVRADGPTKVLEITEADPVVDTRILSVVGPAVGINSASSKSNASLGSTASPHVRKSESADSCDDKSPSTESPFPAASTPKKANQNAEDELKLQMERDQILREQQYALFVSVKVESVSVSLIDAEPAEVIFLSFRDIRLSVERTYQRLTIAATVQDLQVSNQLLNPAFPVALHPRRFTIIKGSSSSARLMLPGLHQIEEDAFPALHLFVQQKLYHNDKSVAGIIASNGGIVNDKLTANFAPAVSSVNYRGGQLQSAEAAAAADAVINMKESKLMYFEMATVWLAPMELNIDEELVVRFMRFTNVIRGSLRKPDMGSLNRLHEEILSIQHHGNRSWGIMESTSISSGFVQFLDGCKIPYMDFTPLGRVSVFLYFSLLQLHPLDIVMNLHSSPSFPVTASEMTVVTILSQIDGARLCLNALVTEHAFGSQSIIMDIIIKHYKASLWRQFHKLIGSADIVEGSVGLVANLGSGVYDLFYEPIEGLLDENGSFLNGLSKGGRSLASRTIGGTSGFTSKITGGLGKGVSFLTMDRDFYRNRASRRLNKTTSVSEGLYVGGKELGKNIVEGFSGIVVAPYRGWEEGGSVGFGMGIAKGILGVALKPAVGVFDLASRATEGIRHSAFGTDSGAGKNVVVRSRIPRSFGRSNVLVPYNNEAAAAQYLADRLINFNREIRMIVVHHQHCIRSLAEATSDSGWSDPLQRTRSSSNPVDSTDIFGDGETGEVADKCHVEGLTVPMPDVNLTSTQAESAEGSDAELMKPSAPALSTQTTGLSDLQSRVRSEAMGKLIASAATSRARASVLMYKDEGSGDFINPTEAWGMTVGNSYVCLISAYRIALTEVRSTKDSKHVDFRFVWSCPATCMDQLYSDARGDLILSVNSSVAIAGPWNSPFPVVIDFFAQNFVLFQSLLEQTIGPRFSRLQPLAPSGGLIQKDLYKRYSSGIKSILLSPTKQTFQLFGYVLYEYTVAPKKAVGNTTGKDSVAGTGPNDTNANPNTEDKKEKKEIKPDDSVTTEVGHIFAKPIQRRPLSPGLDSGKRRSTNTDPLESPVPFSTTGVPEGVLTYVYPLMDIVLLGPYKEDSGKYSLSLSRKDGARMRVLKRETADEHFFEHHKSMLTIVFPDSKSAWKWRHSIESHIVRSPTDAVPTGPLIMEKKKTLLGTLAGGGTKLEGDEPPPNSVLGMLVIPTSNMPSSTVEALKVEIAKTLLLSRR
jgi:hypothetical protein